MEQEISALSRISHQNVIKLGGYAYADEYFALVYERAQQDLEGYTPPNKIELDNLLLGLARGLRAIHSAKFIHWDIQPRNILLMKDGTVQIADFGLATKRNEKMKFFNDRRHGVFNPDDTEEAKEKFDVFCFGNILRQLVQAPELVLREKDRWSPTKCLRTLLSDRCIKGDPNERPSMDEVVSAIKLNRDVLSLLRIVLTSENNVLIENFIAQDIQNEMEPESSSRKRKRH
ncbi:uncharacterized protein [Miscanthus floridulus]|uniref:uncharacterized protein n=1 Tax=Miscanthus floridulus TaxID=154761 RepID=UPI00345A8E95